MKSNVMLALKSICVGSFQFIQLSLVDYHHHEIVLSWGYLIGIYDHIKGYIIYKSENK